MTIGLKEGRPLSEAEVTAFEEHAGIKLPHEYREFVLRHDGAEPDTNIFPVREGKDPGVSISQFIPLREVLSAKTHIDHVSCAFLPVAWASCGNYIWAWPFSDTATRPLLRPRNAMKVSSSDRRSGAGLRGACGSARRGPSRR